MDAARAVIRRMLTEAEALGDCYEAAAQFLIELHTTSDKKKLAKYNLVHGIPTGQGPLEGVRFGHAWLETDGKISRRRGRDPFMKPGSGKVVVDLSNGRHLRMPKPAYYALGNIDPEECVYYTPQEAFERMVEEEIYGPWDTNPPR